MIVFEKRASTILYNWLKSVQSDKIFIIPSHVCPIVPITFLKAKQKFEFVDISEDTFCIDEAVVLERLKSRPNLYAGVVFVRTFGLMRSFESFFRQINEINPEVYIVDDRCLTIPDFDESDSCADVILYSTGYCKFVDLGFGGFATIKLGKRYRRQNLIFAEKCLDDLTVYCKSIINKREEFRYSDTDWLDTSKPDISFSMYRSVVRKKVPTIIQGKSELNKIYSKHLSDHYKMKNEYQNWRFNILVPHKKILLKKIFENGLFASSHYSSLDGIFSEGNSSIAERLHSQIINLFNDRYFNKEKAIQVAELVRCHLKDYT
jgi:dTDP-4-amino-4,6-dideoxygalactose transaminase